MRIYNIDIGYELLSTYVGNLSMYDQNWIKHIYKSIKYHI